MLTQAPAWLADREQRVTLTLKQSCFDSPEPLLPVVRISKGPRQAKVHAFANVLFRYVRVAPRIDIRYPKINRHQYSSGLFACPSFYPTSSPRQIPLS